jgi:hypothetical protein
MEAALAVANDPTRGGPMFVRLLSRTFIETHPALREVLSRYNEEWVLRYSKVLALALPGLAPLELQWRLNFAFSTIFHAFAGNNILRLFMTDAGINARDPRLIATYLVPFVVAGLTAPATPKGT